MTDVGDRTERRDDVVAAAIAAAEKANEMRGEAIKKLLAQRDQIERDLKTLGYVAPAIGPASQNGHQTARVEESTIPRTGARRFRNQPLADVVMAILEESTVEAVHGKEIERLARAGGFTGGTQNFQNYLPVALKRAGGFENIGGNRWRLNQDILPQIRER